jgi:hypothetical protein
MKKYIANINRLPLTVLCTTLLLLFVDHATAGKVVVNGITVSFSKTAAVSAYYDSTDGTLTVSVSGNGALSITVGSTASASWGQYADIYILGSSANLSALTIKGAATCVPFVCGEVGYVKSFALSKGVVGDTDSYGRDFGLGMTANTVPSSISLKNSYTTAQLLGYSNTSALAPASNSADALAAPEIKLVKVGSAEGKVPENAATSSDVNAQKQALIEKIQQASAQ